MRRAVDSKSLFGGEKNLSLPGLALYSVSTDFCIMTGRRRRRLRCIWEEWEEWRKGNGIGRKGKSRGALDGAEAVWGRNHDTCKELSSILSSLSPDTHLQSKNMIFARPDRKDIEPWNEL
jgi:hypothetical protein